MIVLCCIPVGWIWFVYLLIYYRWVYLKEPFPFYRPRK